MESMEALKGKNVLVTGGTGFVGSHLVEELLNRGASVVVTFRSADPRSYFATRKLADRSILAVCDLKDTQRVFDVVTRYEVDYIFHLGAQAIVTTSYHNPFEAIATNVMGTVNVLEAARKFPGVKGVIVASSDKAYGKSSKPYMESDPLRGDHPYEVSKSSADLIALSYYKTYNTPVVVTRFGNIYGEGDLSFNRIIPGVMKALITGETLKLRSDGTFVRDYVYVGDVVLGYMKLLTNLTKVAGEAFNFSSKEKLSVLELIRVVEKVLKVKVPYRIVNTQKNEIPFQTLQIAKAGKLLGFSPRYTLSSTLPALYEWYKEVV